MFNLDITSNFGNLRIGSLSILWGNAAHGLCGYTCVSWGETSIEFGDIDQGKPGIYLTRYDSGEPYCAGIIWQTK